ncbi:hypothetical protein JL722_5848 [Aureococcus anophagefferens]|nr:hypothetical protein JL722_5848 [Aureococcus anophagefferens]
MSNGDAQMRRLVRHRLNAQQEKADAAYVKRLLREERFAKGQARTTSDADRRLAALAQREEMKDCEAKLEQEEADAKVAARLDRELKDGDVAKASRRRSGSTRALANSRAEARALASDEDFSVGQCWRDAMKRVDLEDVGDAVALSVQLPSLADVKVEASGKVVKVVATRASAALRASNKASKDAGPKSVTLKFEMVCPKSASDLASLDEATRAKTLTSLRARLAKSAAAKFDGLKRALRAGPGGDAPDLSLVGLGIAPEAI